MANGDAGRGTAATIDEADPRTGDPYRWQLIRSLLLGQVASGASLTIIALATKDIADELGSTPTIISWAVTGGVLGSAVGGAIGGKLGDLLGHRRMYRVMLLGVVILTLLSAVAWNGIAFLVIRVLAGLGSGATSANSSALVLHAFPAHERTKAIGIYQAALTLAPAIGLLVGGPIVDEFGWRTLFLGFTAIVAAGYVWSWLVVKATTERVERRIDYAGSILIAVTVVTALLFFDRGKAYGFGDAIPWVMLVIACVGGTAFVLVERHAPEPLIRLDYFQRRDFIVPTLVSTALNYAFMGGLVVTPLLLHTRFGYSNTRSSTLLFLRPFFYAITASMAGAFQQWFSVRRVAFTGGAIEVASMLLFAEGARQTNLGLIIAGLVLSGVGLGIATPGLTAASAAASDPKDYGVTSGMRTTITQVGVTSGIQTMTIMVGTTYTAASFAGSFLLGTAVAVLGTGLVLLIRSERATSTLRA